MADPPLASDSRSVGTRLRLDTLIKLRWLAITGQSAAVLVAHGGLGFPLPFGFCFLVIAVSAWLNIALRIRYPSSEMLDESFATMLLAYDVTQISLLLYLTGGLINPFSLFVLAPVMISAMTLSPQRTLILGIMAAGSASLLAVFHLPLPWYPGEALVLPRFYVLAVWMALVIAIAFTGIYASRVVEEARELAQALAATELVLEREQHLSQLDGLAAAAAHELGTPLATIALVARELDKSVPKGSPLSEDIVLLREQVARCREILGKLSSLGSDQANLLDRLPLRDLVAEAVTPLVNFDVVIDLTFEGEGPEPVFRRNPGVIYGLENLIENAVDFAKSKVRVIGTWSSETVGLAIQDDGPGFPIEVLVRLGEPYLRSKATDRRMKNEGEGGLGLGLFIAKTLIERSGALMSITNVEPPLTGARVVVSWPRSAFERDTETLAPHDRMVQSIQVGSAAMSV
jgi:two-component system, sensor histidine kinase RegB